MTSLTRGGRFGRRAAVIIVVVAVVIAGYLVTRLVANQGIVIPRIQVTNVPHFPHAYVLVLENEGYRSIVGSADAPYLNHLISRYGLSEDYRAIDRPSQPNYLAMMSGATHGVSDDNRHEIDAPTLFDQIEASGRDWRVFAENVPDGCFTGATASGGVDGPGEYARKHEPAISFTSISSNPTRCAKIQPLSRFDPAATDFELIIPNLCHDMHDCPVAEGDAWLSRFVPKILDSPAWKDGGALFITFDEPSTGQDRIPMIVVAPDVPSGLKSAEPTSHYSLLRTIEQAWGMPCLAASCGEDTLGGFFRPVASR